MVRVGAAAFFLICLQGCTDIAVGEAFLQSSSEVVAPIPSQAVPLQVVLLQEHSGQNPRGWEGLVSAEALVAKITRDFQGAVSFELANYLEVIEPTYATSRDENAAVELAWKYGLPGSFSLFIMQRIPGPRGGRATITGELASGHGGAILDGRRVLRDFSASHEVGHLFSLQHTVHPNNTSLGEPYPDQEVVMNVARCSDDARYWSYSKRTATDDAKANFMAYRLNARASNLFTPEYELPFRTIINCFIRANDLEL